MILKTEKGEELVTLSSLDPVTEEPKSGLNAFTIALLVIGVLLTPVLIFVVACIYERRLRRRQMVLKQQNQSEAETSA